MLDLDLKLPKWRRSACSTWTSSCQGRHAPPGPRAAIIEEVGMLGLDLELPEWRRSTCLVLSLFRSIWNTSDLDFDRYVSDKIQDDTTLSQASEVKRLVKNICD